VRTGTTRARRSDSPGGQPDGDANHTRSAYVDLIPVTTTRRGAACRQRRRHRAGHEIVRPQPSVGMRDAPPDPKSSAVQPHYSAVVQHQLFSRGVTGGGFPAVLQLAKLWNLRSTPMPITRHSRLRPLVTANDHGVQPEPEQAGLVDTFEHQLDITRRYNGFDSASRGFERLNLYGGWTATATCKSLRYQQPEYASLL